VGGGEEAPPPPSPTPPSLSPCHKYTPVALPAIILIIYELPYSGCCCSFLAPEREQGGKGNKLIPVLHNHLLSRFDD